MPTSQATRIANLRAAIDDLRRQAIDLAQRFLPTLPALPAERRPSAENLLHYLALRQNDLRPLQTSLSRLGLSSLGRSEAHAMATLDAVSAVLARLAGADGPGPEASSAAMETGARLLRANTGALLGPERPGREVRILVTAATEAAYEPGLVRAWLEAGMDALRINCAHDDPDVWARMVAHVVRARTAVGRPCPILMDLAGPKLRTGELEPGPRVVRFQPARDELGRTVDPAQVWLTAQEDPLPPPRPVDATLPVPGSWLVRVPAGGAILLRDTRGRLRRLNATSVAPGGVLATCDRTGYVGTDTRLWCAGAEEDDCAVGAVPAIRRAILLARGDTLVLSADQTPGRGAACDDAGNVVRPAIIPCSLPAILGSVRVGEAIWFDDGKIGGTVIAASAAQLTIRIKVVPPNGGRLGPDKGINLPQSRVGLSGLTADDRASLAFVVEHADMVGQSFLNDPADVAALQEELRRLGRPDLGVVAKIETQRAFANLPRILLQLLHSRRAGVMIARGDLAVECGYERLAEVQEQILWISEAAHLPVIWATQVLESLTRRGVPSRAEITDAAMSDRAECVLLNKGPHLATALQTLDNILRRMQDHVSKKRAMLRPLRVSRIAAP